MSIDTINQNDRQNQVPSELRKTLRRIADVPEFIIKSFETFFEGNDIGWQEVLQQSQIVRECLLESSMGNSGEKLAQTMLKLRKAFNLTSNEGVEERNQQVRQELARVFGQAA